MPRYLYHGVCLESAYALRLPEAPQVCDETLLIRSDLDAPPPAGNPVWTSRSSGYSLYDRRSDACLAGNGVRFGVRRDAVLVEGPTLGPAAEAYLLGGVLSLWFERRGWPVLHGAALATPGGAVALLAPSGGGKSTLAAALALRGHHLVCDDMVPVVRAANGFVVHEGRQEIRLWPDSVRHLVGDELPLPRVVPGTEKRRVSVSPSLRHAPMPLCAIYVLGRRGEDSVEPVVERLGPVDGLMALLSNGFMAEAADALGLGPSRLELLSEVVRTLGVRRLVYPTRLSSLPSVCALLEQNLSEGS